MPRYDGTSFDPPAPLASVTLRDTRDPHSVTNVNLLIDSGADITLLPRHAISRLGIPMDRGCTYELVAFEGSKSVAQAVDLDMIFLQKAFRGRYLLIENERGILGRDVLSSIVLLLDGPAQEWSAH